MKTGIYWQDPKYAVGRDFILDPSLVLYLPLYKLDGASIMSRDAYGHLCTVTGALWKPKGRLFDGDDDDIMLPSGKPVLTDKDITMEAWVNVDDFDGDYTCVFNSIAWRFTLHFKQTTGELRTYINNADLYTGDSAVVAGDWTQIAVTLVLATKELTHYINGGMDKAQTITANPTNLFTVCVGSSDTGGWYDGVIGEVRIYDRALTPLEIQHNYLATKWRYR